LVNGELHVLARIDVAASLEAADLLVNEPGNRLAVRSDDQVNFRAPRVEQSRTEKDLA
jgi:hypothetical protein